MDKERRNFLRRYLNKRELDDWSIERQDFFGKNSDGNSASQMFDFSIDHYIHFLDMVKTKEDLILGLNELAPFVDDALLIAQSLTDMDFEEFKQSLPSERCAAKGEGHSIMPHRFIPLVLPGRFIAASLVAEKARVDMGVALIRIMEEELN